MAVWVVDRSFWTAIKANNFQVPAGQTVTSLTGELTDLLGDPDPELRDALGYEILGTWVAHGICTAAELEDLAVHLMANLRAGIGEQGTDSVFRRSFSALILAEIVNYDSKNSALKGETLEQILGAAERYCADEQDLRGFVPGKGWAHSVAHTADLLWVSAAHPRFDLTHLRRILAAMTAKVTHPTEYAYAAGEADRMAKAALAAVRRQAVPGPELGSWALALAKQTPAMDSAGDIITHQNAQSFLTSLYAMLCFHGLPEADLIRPALSTVAPWFFPNPGVAK